MNGKTNAITSMMKVYTTSELPTRAIENSIYLISNVQATEVYLQKVPPTSPTNGAIWIICGKEFGGTWSLKIGENNSATVHPVAGAQYVNGVWVSKETYIRTNSNWDKLGTPLFVYGALFSDVGNAQTVVGDELRTQAVAYEGERREISLSINSGITFSKISVWCNYCTDTHSHRNFYVITENAQWTSFMYYGAVGNYIFPISSSQSRTIAISEYYGDFCYVKSILLF